MVRKLSFTLIENDKSTVGFTKKKDIVALVQKNTYVECTKYVR